MARVIDFAWGRPSVASLKAAGAVAVCRYLSYDRTGKTLTRAEADGLRAGGIDIVSNWEQAGSWTEYSGGQTTGRSHAAEANRQHIACGGPPGRPIYFSTDFNATSTQLGAVADYYRGVASVIGLARTGAYGGYTTIKYLFDAGVIRWGWQTYAWSSFRDDPAGQIYLHWDPRAQLRQVQNGVMIGGVDCDLNDSRTADFGQWQVGTPNPQRGSRMIVMAHEQGSGVDWIGDGIFRYQCPDAAHRAWALSMMGWQGNPNPTSLEINRGTLAALGPIVIPAPVDGGGIPARMDAVGSQLETVLAALKTVADLISSAGGSIEIAPVLAAIADAAAAESTAVAALTARLTQTSAERDALAARLAAALGPQ